jgi:hypothetical protein
MTRTRDMLTRSVRELSLTGPALPTRARRDRPHRVGLSLLAFTATSMGGEVAIVFDT